LATENRDLQNPVPWAANAAQGSPSRVVRLGPTEFRLLEYLMKHAGQVVTRTMLLENVWDYHFDPQTNVIDVHISRLRQKLDKEFERPLLKTVRGAGYMLEEPEPVAG
jgi:two-component system OmpR family response regulator